MAPSTFTAPFVDAIDKSLLPEPVPVCVMACASVLVSDIVPAAEMAPFRSATPSTVNAPLPAAWSMASPVNLAPSTETVDDVLVTVMASADVTSRPSNFKPSTFTAPFVDTMDKCLSLAPVCVMT